MKKILEELSEHKYELDRMERAMADLNKRYIAHRRGEYLPMQPDLYQCPSVFGDKKTSHENDEEQSSNLSDTLNKDGASDSQIHSTTKCESTVNLFCPG